MYETNTGKHHPRAFRQGHSNKRRSFLDDSLTNHGNLLWTAAVQVGTPPQGFNCQSLFSGNGDVETDQRNVQWSWTRLNPRRSLIALVASSAAHKDSTTLTLVQAG